MGAVPLTLLEYERVRSRSNQFVIVPGHEIPEIEQVTLASDGYFLIRKLYGAAYAEQTDPRSRGETLPVLCSRPSASVPATPPARKEASRG